MSVKLFVGIFIFGFFALWLVHTDRVNEVALAILYARIKRGQLEISLSYCINACVLRRSERAFRDNCLMAI